MTTETQRTGARDFDFLMGRWRLRNQRLREPLTGSEDWEAFESTSEVHPLPGDLGNQDVYRSDHWPGFVGMSFRFFNPTTGQWSIHWADSRSGGLLPPVVGAFDGDVGVFTGREIIDGRSVLVRFIWSGVQGSTPRWEQAFSIDEGASWETNWIMDFTREDGELVDPEDPSRG